MTATDRAIEEVVRGGWCKRDSDYDGMIGNAVIELLQTLGKQGHSGHSHARTIGLFQRAAAGLPLSPITSDASEWDDRGVGLYQNKRCGDIFSDNPESGRAKHIDGVIFEDKDGVRFFNSQSCVEFDLPGYPPEQRVIRESEWESCKALQEEFSGVFGETA